VGKVDSEYASRLQSVPGTNRNVYGDDRIMELPQRTRNHCRPKCDRDRDVGDRVRNFRLCTADWGFILRGPTNCLPYKLPPREYRERQLGCHSMEGRRNSSDHRRTSGDSKWNSESNRISIQPGRDLPNLPRKQSDRRDRFVATSTKFRDNERSSRLENGEKVTATRERSAANLKVGFLKQKPIVNLMFKPF